MSGEHPAPMGDAGAAPEAGAAGAPRAGAEPERRSTDVVVVGGGVAGLVAALECAKLGLDVVVVERSQAPGGCVGRIELEGLHLDSGAESFATRGDSVAELVESLGLADEVVSPNPAGAWLVWGGRDARGGRSAGRGGGAAGTQGGTGVRAAPLPKTGMLGIPANPLGEDVRAIIGWRGAIRAYADRLKPILRIGRAHSLGELVRQRMGAAVLDRLVTPISSGVYSADPNDLDLDVVAPGLNEAMTRAGSLSGGVGELVETRRAGGAVRGLRGGMHRLVDALLAELERFGAQIVTRHEVVELTRTGARAGGREHGGWRVRALGSERDLVVESRFAILAAPAQTSRRLLGEAVEGWADASDWPPAASVEIVTLVLDAPALDAAPRGTGVLVAAGTEGVSAKALTHSSAKWSWLAEAANAGAGGSGVAGSEAAGSDAGGSDVAGSDAGGSDAAGSDAGGAGAGTPGSGSRHVVRLSYGRAGSANPLEGLDDEAVAALALADASVLLGVPLEASALRASGRTAWRDALSHAALGQRERVRALEDALAAEPGIEATGSWIAGTGLASVVPHAKDAAARIRHLAVQERGAG